jgi:thermitase
MQSLYEIGFFATIVSALGWFWLKSANVSAAFFGRSFWFSLILYVLGFFFEDVSLFLKLFLMLPMDVAIFVLLVILFNKYVSKSKILLSLVAIGLLAVKLIFFDTAAQAYTRWFGQAAPEPAQRAQAAAPEPAQLLLVDVAPNGELLLDLGQGKSLAELAPLFAEYGVTYRKAFPNLQHADFSDLEEFYVLDMDDAYVVGLDDLTQKIMASGVADAVELNEEVTTLPLEGRAPQPPGVDYGLNDPGLGNLWGFQAMQMAEFFNLLRSSGAKAQKVAKIAILDTGVDGAHEDLADNYVSTNRDYDRDKVGHGTHCAGIAGAVSNNAKGIASFAPAQGFVQVTSIKVLSDFGSGTQQDIINGIIEAADLGADVISMSLGGPSNDQAQRAYAEAVKYANRAGAVVVVAAGNDDENAIGFAPANAPGVITVSAIDDQLHKAEFSNFVQDLGMGVAAPGVNIYSAFPNNEYKFLSGTSMATPYVAGLVGLMKALRPNLNTQQVHQLLTDTGATTKDAEQTGPLIQPAKVLGQLLKGL